MEPKPIYTDIEEIGRVLPVLRRIAHDTHVLASRADRRSDFYADEVKWIAGLVDDRIDELEALALAARAGADLAVLQGVAEMDADAP